MTDPTTPNAQTWNRPSGVRNALRAGSSGAVLVVMVLTGSVVLWAGVPLLWLWLASQLHYLSGSVGTAMGISFVGMVLTVVVLVQILAWLNRAHVHLREARGLPAHGMVTLEAILSVSAFVALGVFAVWFLGWAAPRSLPYG